MHTLFDFLTHTKGVTYIVAGLLLVCFIPFWQYLTERERKILYLYYGLDDGEERTLEEIGSLLGVTRERIRQIRNRAFEKLRESPHGDSLSGFWNAN